MRTIQRAADLAQAGDLVLIAAGPEVCQPGVPLTFRNLQVYRIGPGDTFDLDDGQGSGGIAYTISAEAGVLSSSTGEIY